MKNRYSYGSLASYLDLDALPIPVDWDAVFGRKAPLEVEIGFGTGEYLVGIARQEPARNFIGFEQSAKRTLKALRKIFEARIDNVRLLQVDAAGAFRCCFAPGAIDRVHCLFPCPWPKKRHAKHRLLSSGFLKLVNSRLKAGGVLRVVTDHAPYAEWIVEEASGSGFEMTRRMIPPTFGTKFEKKWSAAGQQAFTELVFVKVADIQVEEDETAVMKTYFLKEIDPSKVEFSGASGEVSIQFKDFLFDNTRSRGMVQAVVTEDRRTQYVWLAIDLTARGGA